MQLLDKRTDCINKLKELDYIRYAEGRINDEHWHKLRDVLQSAILIFPRKSSKRLDTAADATWLMNWSQKRSEYYRQKRKETLAIEMQEKSWEQEDRAREALDGLVQELENIARIDFWD